MKVAKTIIILILSLNIASCVYGQKHNPEKILDMGQNEVGFPSLCSKDDTIAVSYYRKYGVPGGIYWFQNGAKVKSLDNLKRGEVSPNGAYYSYVSGNLIGINDKQDRTLAKIPTQGNLDAITWSYDSTAIYFCEEGTINKIMSFDIATGVKRVILSTSDKYFNPVIINNPNKIYLLQNIAADATPIAISDIYQYDLLKKEFNKVKLPNIKNCTITYDFTISPNDQIIMFSDISNQFIYVIDKNKEKIIDKIKIPADTVNKVVYSWKSDSSYVVFTTTGREIYKYTFNKLGGKDK